MSPKKGFTGYKYDKKVREALDARTLEYLRMGRTSGKIAEALKADGFLNPLGTEPIAPSQVAASLRRCRERLETTVVSTTTPKTTYGFQEWCTIVSLIVNNPALSEAVVKKAIRSLL